MLEEYEEDDSKLKNLTMLYANNKGAYQPAIQCSLISAVVIRESIIAEHATCTKRSSRNPGEFKHMES